MAAQGSAKKTPVNLYYINLSWINSFYTVQMLIWALACGDKSAL